MDGFFGIGILELFVIAILALIVLGPERLPGVMREGAKYIRALRKMTNEFTSQFSDELKALDELNPRKIFNEMTDPNQPEPGEKPKTQSAKPPAAKTPSSTTPAKPKTATPPAAKPVGKTGPATNGAPAPSAPAATNGHEEPSAVTPAALPNAEPFTQEEQTILPPALQMAAAKAETGAGADALQPVPTVEALAVGELTEGQP